MNTVSSNDLREQLISDTKRLDRLIDSKTSASLKRILKIMAYSFAHEELLRITGGKISDEELLVIDRIQKLQENALAYAAKMAEEYNKENSNGSEIRLDQQCGENPGIETE